MSDPVVFEFSKWLPKPSCLSFQDCADCPSPPANTKTIEKFQHAATPCQFNKLKRKEIAGA